MEIFKKCLITVIVVSLLIYWDVIYNTYIDPEKGWMLFDKTFIVIFGIREELIYRWAPFMITTLVYVYWIKKFKVKIKSKFGTYFLIIVSILFFLSIQLIFSLMHVPWDSIEREMLYELPPTPTCKELRNAIISEGVLGIGLSLIYCIWIPKNRPLKTLQFMSFVVCTVSHIAYNYVLNQIYYGKTSGF